MTVYSVRSSSQKYTVLASWPTAPAHASTAVMSVADVDLADGLAEWLTCCSELAWQMSFWSEDHAPVNTYFTDLAAALQADAPLRMPPVPLVPAHDWDDPRLPLERLPELAEDADDVLPRLNRAQRLSVADEIRTDLDARLDLTGRLLAFDGDEFPTVADASRVHQAGTVPTSSFGRSAWRAGGPGADRFLERGHRS